MLCNSQTHYVTLTRTEKRKEKTKTTKRQTTQSNELVDGNWQKQEQMLNQRRMRYDDKKGKGLSSTISALITGLGIDVKSSTNSTSSVGCVTEKKAPFQTQNGFLSFTLK